MVHPQLIFSMYCVITPKSNVMHASQQYRIAAKVSCSAEWPVLKDGSHAKIVDGTPHNDRE